MNKFALSLLLVLVFNWGVEVFAQGEKIAKNDLAYLDLLNDSLGKTGAAILDELHPRDRLKADSLFTRMLVRGMLVPYSFYYPFDSVVTAPI
ncbi:MAG: hypothetical protein MUE71_01235, partial [Chitinophagaceae bacterium]|nr:hypothetical protein [Chitinophagaceae bacterium]